MARLARLSATSSHASVARAGFFRLVGTLGEVAAEMSDVFGGADEKGEQSPSSASPDDDHFLSELKEALSAVATSSPVGMAAVCR